MVAVTKIDDSMFDEIYRRFLVDDDLILNRDDWKTLFSCRTEIGEDHCGYALTAGNSLVGILGMLYSERTIDERRHRFCNLHTWMVKEPYRGQSLLLMRPALRLSDYTVTDFTPNCGVRKLSKRLGFRKLNASIRILPPLCGSSRSSRKANWQLLTDVDEIRLHLNAADMRLSKDHAGPGFGQAVIRNDSETCFVIYTRVLRCALSYCHVHYISRPDLFVKAHWIVRSQLREVAGVRFVIVNDRALANVRLPLSLKYKWTNEQLYRSPDLSADRIDTLYSDLATLSLSTFSGITSSVVRCLNVMKSRLTGILPFRRGSCSVRSKFSGGTS